MYYLPPGATVYPSGLLGNVTNVGTDTGGNTVVTVVPAGMGLLKSESVDITGPLSDNSQTATSATRSRVIRLSSHPNEGSSPGASGTVDFGKLPVGELVCHNTKGESNIKVSGSISETLTNVTEHFEVHKSVGVPHVSIWLSYEPTLSFDISASGEAKCSLPPAVVDRLQKTFLIGDTGATIAIAPDATFSVSGSGEVSFEQHSYRMIGVASNPDGSLYTIHSERSDPANVNAKASLQVEIYGGVQAKIGELDMIGVDISIGVGLKGSAEYHPNPPQICLNANVFLRASIYGFLNLWWKEWQTPELHADLDLPGFSACSAAPGPPGGTFDATKYEGKILRVDATSTSYYIDDVGIKHWIPNGGTYLCLTAWDGVQVINGVTQAQLDTVPSGSDKACTVNQAFDHIIRMSNRTSYYVDNSGVKHWIPNGGTFLCLNAWDGKALIDNVSQDQVNALASGPDQSCQVTQAFDTIIRMSNNTSYYVDNSGVKHWIPNGGTFLCLRAWDGKAMWDGVSQDQVDALASGPDQSCQVTQAFDTIIRMSNNTSYYVDNSGVKHWIPNGGTFLCLRAWDGKAMWDGVSQDQVDAFASGPDQSCQVTQAFDTIIRMADNTSYYVDNSGVKHWIPNGGTFLCLYDWQGKTMWSPVSQDQLDAFATGGNATCRVPQAENTVIRETTTHTAYFVDGNEVRHWIQDGATYNCLIKHHDYWPDVTWDQVNALAEGPWEPKLNC